MNDVEERLHDALSARADLVMVGPSAFDAIAERRRRRSALRWLRPIGIGATAVAMLGLVVVAGRVIPGEKKDDAAAAAPAHAIAIRNYRAVIFDPDDPGRAPVLETVRQDGIVRAVAGAGNGTDFYVASQYTTKCRSALFRLDANTLTKSEVVGSWSNGYVNLLAVTPDQRFLAYTTDEMRTSATEVEDCPVGISVRIRDLRTGGEFAWPLPGGEEIVDLTVSPDGHYVVYEFAFGRIERVDMRTGEKVTVYGDDRRRVDDCFLFAQSYLPTGELAVAMHCTGFASGRLRQALVVATYDPVTRKPGRRLFDLPAGFRARGLAFDRTGRHALLIGSEEIRPGYHGYDNALFRWDAGSPPRRVLEGRAESYFGEPSW